MHFLDSPNLRADLRKEVVACADKRYYHPTMAALYDGMVAEHGLPGAANYLSHIMDEAKPKVEVLLEQRKAQGLIRDLDQTRKSVAGHAFQSLTLYALASLQAEGLIPKHVICTLKTQKNKKIGNSIIHVGPEEMKPDADLLVYSDRDDDDPVCLFSLKTSLRERAGQTHRWKVLMDIVISPNCHSIKEKYGLKYFGSKNFRMGLITPNFYDELTNPGSQHAGLLRFFEHVYLTKPGEWKSPILSFAAVAADIRRIYA